jgi:uncharacterized protein YecT (DUF1311 family)
MSSTESNRSNQFPRHQHSFLLKPLKRARLRNLLLVLGIISTVKFGIALQDDPCLKIEGSQTELNQCEGKQFQKADTALNHAYRQLLTKYKSNSTFLTKLKAAQLAWLKYRDAQLDVFYYRDDKQSSYGSVYPMCFAMQRTYMTAARTKELESMLTYTEGDVCGFYAPDDASRADPPRPHSSCRAASTSQPGR